MIGALKAQSLAVEIKNYKAFCWCIFWIVTRLSFYVWLVMLKSTSIASFTISNSRFWVKPSASWRATSRYLKLISLNPPSDVRVMIPKSLRICLIQAGFGAYLMARFWSTLRAFFSTYSSKYVLRTCLFLLTKLANALKAFSTTS